MYSYDFHRRFRNIIFSPKRTFYAIPVTFTKPRSLRLSTSSLCYDRQKDIVWLNASLRDKEDLRPYSPAKLSMCSPMASVESRNTVSLWEVAALTVGTTAGFAAIGAASPPKKDGVAMSPADGALRLSLIGGPLMLLAGLVNYFTAPEEEYCSETVPPMVFQRWLEQYPCYPEH
jgi:hypothetical protein